MDYLLKTEPSEYSFVDLQRDAVTVWDGVANPVALKHLREMKPGARLVIYETAERKSAVGTASVVSVDVSDPKNPAVKKACLGAHWPSVNAWSSLSVSVLEFWALIGHLI